MPSLDEAGGGGKSSAASNLGEHSDSAANSDADPQNNSPGSSQSGDSSRASSQGPRLDMPTYAMDGTWELRAADGQVYGPVEKLELDQWADEGRISPACYVRESNGEWYPAGQLYPGIATAKATQPEPFYVGDHTTAAHQGQMPYGHTSGNPFATPAQTYVSQNATRFRPHNGVVILVFGILGLACCGIFGLVAWIMGASDLRAIKRGEMDPSGKGLVTAGYVLGIIGCIITVLGMFGIFIGEML